MLAAVDRCVQMSTVSLDSCHVALELGEAAAASLASAEYEDAIRKRLRFRATVSEVGSYLVPPKLRQKWGNSDFHDQTSPKLYK